LANKLETIDLCLRILKLTPEVSLSQAEVDRIRKIVLVYLDAELGLPVHPDPLGV
jgi:hypothetical protein